MGKGAYSTSIFCVFLFQAWFTPFISLLETSNSLPLL